MSVYHSGHLHIVEKMCDTCIFGPNNIVAPDRVTDMVTKAHRSTAGNIICHSTRGRNGAVCYGFYKLHATQLIQVAERLGCVIFDKPRSILE